MKARTAARAVALLATTCLLATGACRSGRADPSAAERTRVQREMHALIGQRVGELLAASRDLAAAAPLPSGRGWDPQRQPADAAAIAAMKEAWARARTAYELVEGALAPMFPESDVATDARYDDFVAVLGPAGDADPFDGAGVTGMHAIERILWADAVPTEVATHERGLPGYRPAAFPATESEARAFKEKLAAKLVSDVDAIRAQLASLELDVTFVARGMVDLAVEQAEKVDRASSGREESRYAQTTMRDLRANRQGCLEAYGILARWLLTRPDGAAADARVRAAFERLRVAYDAVPGDAIPHPPAGWAALKPAPELLTGTPFGRLYATVRRESDQTAGPDASLVASLMAGVRTLGLPAEPPR